MLAAEHYIRLGVRPENMILCDSTGVVYEGRTEGMNSYKKRLAARTEARTLADALQGADIFVGLSVAGCVTPDMVRSMADRPIIFAMANPVPEIGYEEAKAARPDVIMATGRSDFRNQVNNVLGFPFIFRGALDVRACTINHAMEIAATHALADLTKEDVPDSVLREQDYPFSTLKGDANVLIFPSLEAANAAYKLMLRIGGAEAVGPILTGLSKPVHVLQRGATVEEIVNMAAIAVAHAGMEVKRPQVLKAVPSAA